MKRTEDTRNTARFCVENPHITWVLLIGTILWGLYGYTHMPQRKDPDIPLKAAMVETPWPGASAEKVEELVTKTVEQVIASNTKVSKIDSTSRSNTSVIVFSLADDLNPEEVNQVLDDIGGRLAAVRNLPDGAGPINYQRDFGDTATLMLTVASPKATGPKSIFAPCRSARPSSRFVPPDRRGHRSSSAFRPARRTALRGSARSIRRILEIDGCDARSKAAGRRRLRRGGPARFENRSGDPGSAGGVRPRLLPAIAVGTRHLAAVRGSGPERYAGKLASVAGEKYSYRELDDFTDTMEKALLATGRKDVGSPLVAKVSRSGVLQERVYLVYSQERLASYGIKTGALSDVLRARNLTMGGGEFDAGGKSVLASPSGEFHSEREIGDVTVGATSYGTPLYLRDVADIVRSYDTPPRYLNYYSWIDAEGHWQRTRAITLTAQMGAGQQIDNFARQVDVTLESLKDRLPKDLIVARTSDQPRQVEENVELFMMSLYEAIGLVILVSLIGFWEWRSALLMALSIPLTLLMTFGMMSVLGIDIQQVSIATLIIALGLLVDDPVVAGDAIKRELASGQSRGIAAWLGPTKLATAILYATITNIVAYLPFLILDGTMGQFLYSLPVVMTCSLVASRVVSMTFIPMLGA